MSSSSPGGGSGRPPIWVVVLALLVLMARLTEAAQNLRHVLAESDSDSITKTKDKIKPKIKPKTTATNDLVDTDADAATSKLVQDDVVEDTAEPISTPIVKNAAAKDTTEKNLRRLAESSNNDQDADDEVEPDFMYWVTPIASLGLTCGGSSIKSRDGEYTCIKAGEALCQDNDGGPFGRWTFGITEDNQVNLWTPKNEIAWTFCTEVSHVCIGEERDPRPDKYSNQRPYLYFYDEKTQRTVGNLTCDGTDGFNGENLDKPTILKMVDNSDVGMYANYNITVLKFKKGQTPDPGDSNELLNITVDKVGDNMVGSLSFSDDKCTWTDLCEQTSNSVSAIIEPDGGGIVTLTDVVKGTFPPEFFGEEVQVTVTTESNAADKLLFDQTTLLHSPRIEFPYQISVFSSGPPTFKKFASFTVDVPESFAASLPDSERIGVFIRVGHSSDNMDPFDTFALISSRYEKANGRIKFTLPTFALTPNGDGSYGTVIGVASILGPAITTRRRLNALPGQSKCGAASIRCPLGNDRCDDAAITSPFDMNRFHPILKVIRPHWGVDYSANEGEAVFSVADGSVTLSGFVNGYGETIVLQHPDGSSTLYAHLSTRLVSTGDTISRGDKIGEVGSTGLATASHLHLEYAASGEFFRQPHRIDPHPCTQILQSGSITIGDNGPRPDDSFQLLIDGVDFGTTEIGQRENNVAVNELLPREYILTIVCVVAPDSIGTYQVKLSDGLTFSDGATFKDYRSEGKALRPGESIDFRLVVPDFSPEIVSICDDGIDDGAVDIGECVDSSNDCPLPKFLSLPAPSGQCLDFSDRRCCFSTPKCYDKGGKCLSTSECGPGTSNPESTSVEKLCPGDNNIQCCVPNNACEARGGRCKQFCEYVPGSEEIDTPDFCPDPTTICCIESPTCYDVLGNGGVCLPESTCNTLYDGKIASESGACDAGNDNACCVDAPSCYVMVGDEPTQGLCQLDSECTQSGGTLIPAPDSCPYDSSGCCVPKPAPPPVPPTPMSKVSGYQLNSILKSAFGLNTLVKNDVAVYVQCFKFSDGKVLPQLMAGTSAKVSEKDSLLDVATISGPFSKIFSDNNDLHVWWEGLAMDKDFEYGGPVEAAIQALSEVANTFTVLDIAMGNEIFSTALTKAIEGAVQNLPRAVKLKSAFREGVDISGTYGKVSTFASQASAVETLTWLMIEFFEADFFWLYRRNFNFQCVPLQGGDRPYEVKGYEMWGENGNEFSPVINLVLNQKIVNSIQGEHDEVLPKYELPPDDRGEAFTQNEKYVFETQLVDPWVIDTVLVHHRYVLDLTCTTFDNSVYERGSLGPFVIKVGKTWGEMFSQGPQQQEIPVVNELDSDDPSIYRLYMSGVAADESAKNLKLGLAALSVTSAGFAILAAAPATGPAAPGVAVGALIAIGIGALVGAISKGTDNQYVFGYARYIEFSCENGYVERKEELRICSSLETNDPDDYLVRVEDTGKIGYDGDLKDIPLREVIAPTFSVTEDCETNWFE